MVQRNLKKCALVRILKAVDVIIQPGIAVVENDSFENNDLALTVGTEVYALAEWEYGYFHAWYDGHKVEGGLPIGDSISFKLLTTPKTERWLYFEGIQPKSSAAWVIDSISFQDRKAIDSCKRIPHH